MEKRVLAGQNPYQFGKPLKENKARIWRYQVGNYRILYKIEDKALIVLVIAALKGSLVAHGGDPQDRTNSPLRISVIEKIFIRN